MHLTSSVCLVQANYSLSPPDTAETYWSLVLVKVNRCPTELQTRTAVSPAEPKSRHKTEQNIPQKTLALTLWSLVR
jgi:hypothetical protein